MSSRNGWLWAACAAGLVHAAFSAYWALGGQWLVDTVGQWAVDWAREAPATATAVLLAVTCVKVAAAVGPLFTSHARFPGRRALVAVSWAGAVILVAYGLANTVGAWLVLGGAVRPDGPRDQAALVGHAVLWDPLFLLWGALLAAGLRTARHQERPRAPEAPSPSTRGPGTASPSS